MDSPGPFGTAAFIIRLATCITASVLVISPLPAKENPLKDPAKLHKITELKHAFFDANRINSIMMNNGQFVSHTITGNSGMEWPKGSFNLIDFASGIWIAGIARSDGLIRTAAAEFASEFQPGKILPHGKADNPNLPQYRWYKISRQDLTTPGTDYLEWPVADGAPVDESGKPLLLGDQTLWCVFNDADTALHNKGFETKPIGIEVQMTVWGYDRSNFWGDVMFVKTLIIHKGTEVFDSTYAALWNDPDLGDAGDDYVGCDTTCNLGFVYNADNEDATYGTPPPAMGKQLLQGPIVPSSGDTALVSGKRIAGFKNLGMTTFPWYRKIYEATNGQEAFNYTSGRTREGLPLLNPQTGDTTTFVFPGDPETGAGWTASQSTSPQDVRLLVGSGPFTFSPGDTQEVVFAVVIARGSSHLSSVTRVKENALRVLEVFNKKFLTPELSRITIESEQVSPTTTNVAISSEIIGVMNLTLVEMEFMPEGPTEVPLITDLFDDGLHGDGSAGDGTWGNTLEMQNRKYPYSGGLIIHSPAGVDTIRGMVPGLRLRPIPAIINWRIIWENGQQDRTLNNGESVHMAFDIENTDEINAIDEFWINRWPWPEQYFPQINDTLRIERPIQPGQTFTSDSLFLNVGGGGYPRQTITATFSAMFDRHPFVLDGAFPVTRWFPGSRWLDSVKFTVVQGDGLGIAAIITDPSVLNGHTYLLTIYRKNPSAEPAWQLRDETTGTLRIEGVTFLDPVNPTPPIIDGIRFEVSDRPEDFAAFLCIANATGRLTSPDMAAFAFNASGFPKLDSALLPFLDDRPVIPNLVSSPSAAGSASGGLWGIHTGRQEFFPFSSETRYDFDSFKSQVTSYGLSWNTIFPNDFEIRFTPAGGKALLLSNGTLVDVPFELWNIGLDTPEDPADDFRMIPYVTDSDSTNSFNLTRRDHAISGGTNDPLTDWFDFVEPIDKTPGMAGYDAWVSGDGDTAFAGSTGMSNIVLVNWNGGSVTDSTWPANVNQLMPAVGTIYRIMSSETHDPGDMYRIVAPSNANGEFVRFDLLQNYPNPFNAATKVPFTVQREERVVIEIFDILGRTVRHLRDEVMRPGSHQIEWSGLSDAGKAVSSGTYFVRMRAGEMVETIKVMIVR